MSCDNNRHHFFDHAAKPGSSLERAFGSSREAHQALEQIFQTARAGAQTGNKALQIHAEAHTRALFAEMQATGIDPPTHSKSGLPRKDAQFGYAAVHQTLDAIKKGASLPGVARAVLQQTRQSRTLSAVGFDSGGFLRCGNCGRFASPARAHLCPMTATAEKLKRSLQRYLGVSAGAYDHTDLETLLGAAQDGTVCMHHNLTGERVEVTLDGLPLAMATGFTPDALKGDFQQIELPDGRVVSVRNPEDFPLVTTSGQALVDTAAAYGLSTDGSGIANALVVPDITLHAIQEDADTNVSDGQEYDQGHFMGTEYRKRDAQGTEVSAAGVSYTIGSRSQDQADWSTARINGDEPAPRGGVAVGRTLVDAVGILSAGEVVRTGDGQIQVFDAGRRNLLSIYDPSSNTAGDTAGNPNASAAQMAAVMAFRSLHPRDQFDLALATDLARVQNGSGTPLAAADSAYITMKNNVLAGGGTLTLGGQVGARKCPDCGQFMGNAHNCPVSSTTPKYSSPSQVSVQVDASDLGEQIAAALRENSAQQTIQVQFDDVSFSQAMQAAASTSDMSELRDAMTRMAEAIGTISSPASAASGTGADPFDTAQGRSFSSAVDRLTSTIQGMPASGTILMDASTGKERCPKCGQYADSGHSCPERQPRQVPLRPEGLPQMAQEHIFSPVQLQAPDPYLQDVSQEVGGDLYQALFENIPELDPNFEINQQTESIMRSISAMLQAGQGKEDSGWSRAFGLYGPPGTGKNTLARQLAASIQTVDEEGQVTQGMNYVEANITPESSMQELIGATVLEADPESGATISRARLGKIGLAAAMGSVICVNEIVRNPKLATALQSMMEDGEIQIDSPEGGLLRIPVHPSTVFALTWNPGNEGDPDRPGAAPLSRIIPFRMDRPTIDEQAQRVKAQIANLQGLGGTSGGENRRQAIIGEQYGIPKDWTPDDDEIITSTRFINEVAVLAEGGVGERQIGLNSDTSTAPGPRQLSRFVMLGKTVGWNTALETLKITCDQDSMFEGQWRLVKERFQAHFGDDGGAIARRQQGQAPQES